MSSWLMSCVNYRHHTCVDKLFSQRYEIRHQCIAQPQPELAFKNLSYYITIRIIITYNTDACNVKKIHNMTVFFFLLFIEIIVIFPRHGHNDSTVSVQHIDAFIKHYIFSYKHTISSCFVLAHFDRLSEHYRR
jgi:hypothetical protein